MKTPFVVVLLCASPVAAQALRPNQPGVSPGGVAAAGACMKSSTGGNCTMTQASTYSGVTIDITTAGNEDLTLDPGGGSGSGSLVFISEDDDIDLGDSGAEVIGKIDMDAANNTFMIANNGAAGGAAVFRSQVAYIGTKQAAGTTDAVACFAETITDDDGSCLITALGGGDLRGLQATTGTPPTWRIPTLATNTGGSAPTCAGAATAYGNTYAVDDTNDTAVAMMCWCRRGADDATLANVSVHDNSTSCITAAVLGADHEVFTFGMPVVEIAYDLDDKPYLFELRDGFYVDVGTLLYVRDADIVWRWHPIAWAKAWGWAVLLLTGAFSAFARFFLWRL